MKNIGFKFRRLENRYSKNGRGRPNSGGKSGQNQRNQAESDNQGRNSNQNEGRGQNRGSFYNRGSRGRNSRGNKNFPAQSIGFNVNAPVFVPGSVEMRNPPARGGGRGRGRGRGGSRAIKIIDPEVEEKLESTVFTNFRKMKKSGSEQNLLMMESPRLLAKNQIGTKIKVEIEIKVEIKLIGQGPGRRNKQISTLLPMESAR